MSKGDSSQLNFEYMIQLEEIKEEEAPKLELKHLLEKLKYTYLGD